MSFRNREDCGHSSWTGYEGYCVCSGCGMMIHYKDIVIDKNPYSLKRFIDTVSRQIPDDVKIDFDVGITSSGTILEGGTNRAKFQVKVIHSKVTPIE